MLNITYTAMVGIISILWLIARAFIWKKNKKINWKRELQLMLVYIPILVVVRFTFCPFGLVDGQIQPLVFDASNAWPPRINLLPFVYLFDYPNVKEALLNFIGNTAMFIPIGAVWPIVFKVKRYSSGTQFVMITHRRGTMEAANRLYGVTMPERGISKVLELNIDDISKKKGDDWDGILG